MRTQGYGFAPHEAPPRRFDRAVGMLGQLNALTGQQDESELMRERIAQMQQQTQQGEMMGPLEHQLGQQKLRQMLYENDPQHQQLQNEMLQAQAKRYDPFADILQAASYSGDPKLVEYLLRQKGLLGADYGQTQITPEDMALKQAIQQRLSKGAR